MIFGRDFYSGYPAWAIPAQKSFMINKDKKETFKVYFIAIDRFFIPSKWHIQFSFF